MGPALITIGQMQCACETEWLCPAQQMHQPYISPSHPPEGSEPRREGGWGFGVMKEDKRPRRRLSGSVYPRTKEPLQPSAGVREWLPKVRGDADGVGVVENLVK
jgi:hypothetical protein